MSTILAEKSGSFSPLNTLPKTVRPEAIPARDILCHGLGGSNDNLNKTYYPGLITMLETPLTGSFDYSECICPYSLIILESILSCGFIAPRNEIIKSGIRFNTLDEINPTIEELQNYVNLCKPGELHSSFRRYAYKSPALLLDKAKLNETDHLVSEPCFRYHGIDDPYAMQGEYKYLGNIPFEFILGLSLPAITDKVSRENMAQVIECIQKLEAMYDKELLIVNQDGESYHL